jgi:hypothetical protein
MALAIDAWTDETPGSAKDADIDTHLPPDLQRGRLVVQFVENIKTDVLGARAARLRAQEGLNLDFSYQHRQ